MKNLYLYLLIVLLGCASENSNSVEKIKSSQDFNIQDAGLFKFDSVSFVNRILNIHISDTSGYYNPVIFGQRTAFMLRKLNITDAIDSVKIHYSLPKRVDGDISVYLPKNNIRSIQNAYKDEDLETLVSFMISHDSESFLDLINTELAIIIYKDKVTEKAFAGINSIDVIMTYLQECENGRSGMAHDLIEKYEKFEGMENKELKNDFLSLLNKLCESKKGNNKN